ncbi:serine/threonine-protein phosphatase 6 regulatory subunit [Acrasis kona]|uniref:Serine/threonine-protein phosphatase 6 regulatory subunit n=1 Tax=Acrasis kona TaxID=1008807 RepID=A0AAW2YV90_9EUKA
MTSPQDNDLADDKKIRTYVMLRDLLDLDRPIVNSKMVDFLQQDGVIDVLLNFISRLHIIISPEGDAVVDSNDNDVEVVLNRRSWQAVDILSRPTSTAFSDSLEKHLPHILVILFRESFAPENNRCNYFHFMKLMENLLTNHRARVFEILQNNNIILDCVVPALSRHPMITHLLLYLIEMSQPLTSSNGNNFIIKRKFQAHLAQHELLQVVLRRVYIVPQPSNDYECDIYAEFFMRAVSELCVQEKGRQVQFERNRRAAKERVRYLGKEYIEQEKIEKRNSGQIDLVELDCVGAILESLVTKTNADFENMLNLLVEWENSQRVARICCARIILYILQRINPTNPENAVVHQSESKETWMVSDDDDEEDPCFTDKNLITMVKVYKHIMNLLFVNLDKLSQIICRDSQVVDTPSQAYSAYIITHGFSTLRMDVVNIFHKTIVYMYDTCHSSQPTILSTIIQSSNVLGVLIDWFFEYKYNNMYHNLFTQVMVDLIRNGETAVLKNLLETHDLLTRIMDVYQDPSGTDNRAHMLHLCNLLRLMYVTLQPESYLYQYLKNNDKWIRFLTVVSRDTLRMINKQDQSDIDIGSQFAADAFGFEETDRYNKPFSPVVMNDDDNKSSQNDSFDVFEYKE